MGRRGIRGSRGARREIESEITGRAKSAEGCFGDGLRVELGEVELRQIEQPHARAAFSQPAARSLAPTFHPLALIREERILGSGHVAPFLDHAPPDREPALASAPLRGRLGLGIGRPRGGRRSGRRNHGQPLHDRIIAPPRFPRGTVKPDANLFPPRPDRFRDGPGGLDGRVPPGANPFDRGI